MLRIFLFFFGLVCFGLGGALAVKVKYLGLHPWDVLNVGLYQRYGLSIGSWSVICGMVLVIVSLFVDRRYINVGTFLNALLIGPILDFFLWLDILPNATNTWTDYLILLSGIIITGIGGGMYVAAGIGAGPRDGFMLSISDKTGLSVSKARILVESLVLIIGYFLGGPVFVVTFVYTFIQSPVFQQSLKYFRKWLGALERKHIREETGHLESCG
ncbi:YczE/YyaS/YitT family protein [Brevibacillus massiliensis]|uniref:YczE/YyaS/YitT family protein n=1 Tax=Brevibacillus massiliensis TaxID=1118054 RepID=UPI00054FC61C|nr:membrane protein [Brevibacillus massiliensis]